MVNATVKLAVLPDNETFANARANAGAVVVSQNGNDIVISGDLDDLIAFPSSVQAQGTHKWIALDINTHTKSIVGMTWRGSALTQDDEDEAVGVGLGKGHIIYWAKADVIADTPDEITIGAEDKEAVTITVSFE